MKISYLLDILGHSSENVCVNVFYDGSGINLVSVRGPAEQVKNAIAGYENFAVLRLEVNSDNNFNISINSEDYTSHDPMSNSLHALLDVCLPEQPIKIIIGEVAISGRAEQLYEFVNCRYDVAGIRIDKYLAITIKVEESQDD